MPVDRHDSVALDRLPRFFWPVLVVACLSSLYVFLQVGFVRPYLWPAGHGAALAGDSTLLGVAGRGMLVARPPEVTRDVARAADVDEVVPESLADRAGLARGDRIVEVRSPRVGTIALAHAGFDAGEQIRRWREAYWMGLRGPIAITVASPGPPSPVGQAFRPAGDRQITLDRPTAWNNPADVLGAWAKRQLAMSAQIVVFLTTALFLLYLRSSDVTAALAVLALTLCAVGGGGPLMGSEATLPWGLRQAMTVFAWVAAPIAFPFVALAIAYFPRKSALLARHSWLHAIPFLAAGPMIATGTLTGLYLAGADWAHAAAVWDARHPTAYYLSFALALAINVLAVVEGLARYQANRDQNERRRIQIALLTTVPGVFAYVLKDGVPTLALLTRGSRLDLPWWLTTLLQLIVLLPAFGVTYSVAVHRVLGPQLAIRRSMQYALANRTLTLLAAVPATALTVSLVRQRNMSLATIVTGQPLFYIVCLALVVTAHRYRERARSWLDRRFFREQYDAREILLSLASRIPFETDPNDLTALVVERIDTALHPEVAAVLVSGLEEGLVTPVSVLHGSAESLALDGGLLTMLRWSEEPLEIDLGDARSPARRLPPAEQDWLECTGATLLVPVYTRENESRRLVAVIALGEKRSEEPYTAEDRQLLASIAAQVSLALDVARLRRRASDTETPTGMVTVAEPSQLLLVECPQCGRCEDASVRSCPLDGTPMATMLPIPRVVDRKYRIDQLIGRGGMGAVYRARDVRLDRDVALKVVRADLLGDPEARTRFRREAQIIAKLQHPAVVSVFDYGTFQDGGAYLIMELVRGSDLRQMLKRDAPLAPDRAVRLLSAICAGIEAAHRAGILHRDLKPENILLPESAVGDVDAKVLDFGVAKLLAADTSATGDDLSRTLTMHGQAIGTPAYMAPEQLRGGGVDARTDVFSLGVIAFEMLTGTLPFGKGPLVEIAMLQAQGPPPMGDRGRPPLPALEAVIRAALGTDPAGRPASPAAFSVSLQSAVAEPPRPAPIL